MKKRIAFVDPVVSSAYLGQILHEAGFESIAIMTSDLTPFFAKRLAPYQYDYLLTINPHDSEDFASKMATLKLLQPSHIFYGAEFSIAAADKITQTILPDTQNALSLTGARTDKYTMYQKLFALKSPYLIQQVKVTAADLANISQIVSSFTFPVFIKPTSSALTMGVSRCASFAELNTILPAVLKNDLQGKVYDQYLIQEYIDHDEYIVDTVSLNGAHHILGICKCNKDRSAAVPVPVSNDTISSENSLIWDKVELFINEILTSLGFLNGLAHTEFFLLRNGNIKLIEVNFRISGAMGYVNKMFKLVFGRNAIELFDFVSKTNARPMRPKTIGHARRLLLHHWGHSARPFDAKNTNELLKIPSYQEHVIFYPDIKTAPSVRQFEYLYDSVGQVLLYNNDYAKLAEDSQTIENLFNTHHIF